MGFFTVGELNKKAKKIIDVTQLETECGKCKLYTSCMSPKIKISGEGRKKILVISEFPSEDDDQYGVALSGS